MWRAAVFAVLEISAVLFGWYQYQVLWKVDDLRFKKAMTAMVLIALTVSFNVMMIGKTYSVITQLNICCTYTLLCIIGMIDLKTHKIPNKLLIVGVILKTALLTTNIIMLPNSFWEEITFSFVGLAFGLGVMLMLSLITKHGIGYGDVKLFGWLGYTLGMMDTYSVLFYSVLYAALAGVYLIVVKKSKKKTKIPFAPFIFLGAYSVFIMRFLS